MKKSLYFLSITLLMFFSSCSSSDDSSSASSNSDLVGKWELSMLKLFPAGTVITGNENLLAAGSPCSTKMPYNQFNSNGTAVAATYDSSCIEELESGTYTKDGLMIDFYTNNIYDGSWEIVTLNSTTLTVRSVRPSTVPFYVYSYTKI